MEIEGVPTEVLNPRSTWDSPDAYDAKARELAGMFADNFEKYAEVVGDAVSNVGPLIAEKA